MSEEIKECIEDLLTVACCPGHDESCKNVYNYVIEIQEQNKELQKRLDFMIEQNDKKQQILDKIKELTLQRKHCEDLFGGKEKTINDKILELLEEIE